MVRSSIRAFSVLFVLACVLATSCTSSAGENVGPDPTSLSELRGLGGGSFLSLTSEEIATLSDVVVEAEVLDIKRTRLNTADGLFPSGDEIETLGFGELEALTDVEVRVVKAWKQDLAQSVVEAEVLVVTVGGGIFETVLDADQAEAIDKAEIDAGEEPAQDQDPRFIWGASTEVELTEGERVVIFLTRLEIPGYGDADSFEILSPTHPGGVLEPGVDGQWVPRFVDMPPVDSIETLVGQ